MPCAPLDRHRPPSPDWLRLLWLACLAIACWLPWGAQAQTIESLLAPGELIQGHAKVEGDCKACHVRFDRKAQDGQCMACHKDVGADVKARTGFHGRLKPQTCNSCHTDHKGRQARIVELDTKRFDHTQTDFPLAGRHVKVECVSCHTAGQKHRDAPQACVSCHKKDDKHKGGLGTACADCHSDTGWKDIRFDHDKRTRFALLGKHADTACTDCHRNNVYKDTPKTCIGCHRKDDDSARGHKGLLGDKCDSCHNSRAWKPADFNHDTDTRYALRGRHRSVVCADCHTAPVTRFKPPQACYACHKKDDAHKESLGKDCASCHSERNWKEPARFDHDKTAFPLKGSHEKADCKDCHKSQLFKDAPKDCVGCHKQDDKHEGTLGTACADCHSERNWKDTRGRFDHDKTRFALRNAHAEVTLKCSACHASPRQMRNTPMACVSCHKKDDKHEGSLGERCDSCHSDRTWKTTRFDHSKTRFALTGQHAPLTCDQCHKTQRYKEVALDCVGCHLKDDRHKQRLGSACDSCHNSRAWAVWEFDHDRSTRYRLEGAHARVACESCHAQPAPKGKPIAPVSTACVSCHRKDDVHDRQFGTRCETCHTTTDWRKVLGRVSQAPIPARARADQPALTGRNG